MQTLLVTGMQRSGTTLLEKLLSNHPRISLLSQPFPLFLVELKRRFLRGLGESAAPYPLGDLFLEERYGAEDVRRFFASLSLTASDARAVFDGMTGFTGQYSRFAPDRIDRVLAELESGDPASILAQLYRSLAHKPGADYAGGKETLWEEIVPFLLERGAAAVIILRDPRDVLASLNHGRGAEHGGRLKPTLFNIRNWRKSVAFALHLEDHPRFLWLRYEDLVTQPREVLDRIATFLGVEPFADVLFSEGIRDQSGQLWMGNSSHQAHRGIDASSVAGYREILSTDVTRYVEATCWPELRRLGYATDLEWSEAPGVIRGFADPYEVTREELRGFAGDSSRVAEELRRCALLNEGSEDDDEARRFFLFENVFHQLRAVRS
jgi:hypothetical protein